MMMYNWLAGVQFLEFMVFNVESEFLSLFVHGFKTAESKNNLIVANLQKHPWVAIFCKTPPNPQDKEATREHEKEMVESSRMSAGCVWIQVLIGLSVGAVASC